MVVANLDIVGISIFSAEANSSLAVNAYEMLSGLVTMRLEQRSTQDGSLLRMTLALDEFGFDLELYVIANVGSVCAKPPLGALQRAGG